MIELQRLLSVELRRRGEALPAEIEALKVQSEQPGADEDGGEGMGIHQSQIRAIKGVLDKLLPRQANALAAFADPNAAGSLTREEFTRHRSKLQAELTGAHSVMAVFRHLFAQRKEPAHRDVLDAADLVAALCYLPCMEQANKWRNKDAGSNREPPLTYLNAMRSPAAITRHKPIALVGLKLFGGLEMSLPVPLISFAFHDATAFWSLGSVYHEVGHLLDLDLGLSKALKPPMEARMSGSPRAARWAEKWMGELVGDAFGVLLGGAGFANLLMSMLYDTDEDVFAAPADDAHPGGYVRVFLLGALLRATGVAELAGVAGDIEAAWREYYGEPADLQPHVKECDAVADVLLNTPLPGTLDGREGEPTHCLRDFARGGTVANAADCARDHARAVRIADFLRKLDTRPAADESWIRLIPAASHLAFSATRGDVATRLPELHTRSLQFIKSIEHRQFLAGPNDAHEKFLDKWTDEMDFSAMSH